MKVYILEEKDGFMVLSFEYVVPIDPLSEGDLLFPAVPYMRSAPSSVPDRHIQVALNPGTENERWEAVVDLRGTSYWVDGVPYVIQKIGEEVPEGASLTQPVAIPSKQELLNSITVTTQSGKTFDGNETARTDMLVALTVGEWINETQTYWKMANNDTLLVTKEELQEALTLAIQEKGRIVGAIN